jgi:hypothetical protein
MSTVPVRYLVVFETQLPVCYNTRVPVVLPRRVFASICWFLLQVISSTGDRYFLHIVAPRRNKMACFYGFKVKFLFKLSEFRSFSYYFFSVFCLGEKCLFSRVVVPVSRNISLWYLSRIPTEAKISCCYFFNHLDTVVTVVSNTVFSPCVVTSRT